VRATAAARYGSKSHAESANPQCTHVVLVVDITTTRPRRLGKYLLGQVLGQGASGVVRVGRNTQTGDLGG